MRWSNWRMGSNPAPPDSWPWHGSTVRRREASQENRGLVATRMVNSSVVFVEENRPGRSTGRTRKRVLPFPNRPEGGNRSFLHRIRAFESTPMNEVTQILSDLARGDARAAGQLLPLVYDELRRLAAARLAAEPAGNTLQPTALVHEAYLRLVGTADGDRWDHRGHFFAAAAEAMRRILVENARRKKSQKRGGGHPAAELDEADWISTTTPDEVLAVDDALTQLAKEDAPDRKSVV